jgi:transposase
MDDPPRTSILPIAKSKRRYRSIEEKLKIIEEALVPGASVAAVARSHDLNANLVFQWRKLYRAGLFPPKAEPDGVGFLPVRVEEEIREMKRRVVGSSAEKNGTIEVQLGKAQVRIAGRVNSEVVRCVLECLLG